MVGLDTVCESHKVTDLCAISSKSDQVLKLFKAKGRTDGRTDGRTKGNPISPFRNFVATGDNIYLFNVHD